MKKIIRGNFISWVSYEEFQRKMRLIILKIIRNGNLFINTVTTIHDHIQYNSTKYQLEVTRSTIGSEMKEMVEEGLLNRVNKKEDKTKTFYYSMATLGKKYFEKEIKLEEEKEKKLEQEQQKRKLKEEEKIKNLTWKDKIKIGDIVVVKAKESFFAKCNNVPFNLEDFNKMKNEAMWIGKYVASTSEYMIIQSSFHEINSIEEHRNVIYSILWKVITDIQIYKNADFMNVINELKEMK